MAKNLQVIENWHRALNEKDKDGMAALVKKNVKIGGPRGEVEGVHVMLEWIDRANVVLTPKRYFSSGSTVVVEELGEWHSPEGEIISAQTVASVFVVENDFIASIYRYEDVNEALEIAGLSEKDRVE